MSSTEYSEASDHVRLPLTSSRRKYVFRGDEDNGDIDEQIAVNVQMKWKPISPQRRCDLDLCAIVFDYEGKLVDSAFFNHKSCPGIESSSALSQTDSDGFRSQNLRISFDDLHPLAKVVMVFMSCAPGNEFRDLADGSHVDVIEGQPGEGQVIYTLPLTQNPKSLFSRSASMVVCRFHRRDTGNQNWELLTIGQCCDMGVRYLDLFDLLVDHFPVSMKEEGIQTVKQRVRQQAREKLDFTKETFVSTEHTFDSTKEESSTVSFCLGWDAQYGHSRSMHFLDANVISYGRYGTKLDLVDNIAKCSRDKSTVINLEDYRYGNRTDEVVRVDLTKVANNVHTIVFVAIAASATMDAGFFRMSSPYVRIKSADTSGEGQEVYRFTVPQKYMHEDAEEKSIIAAKLTRDVDNPTVWKLTPISELSTGNHGVYDEVMIGQIDRHVDRMEIPDVEFLSSEHPTQSLKDTNGIVVDFSSMNNTESVHVLQLNEFGKDVSTVSRTFLPRDPEAKPRPWFTLKIPSKQRTIARYRYLPYDFAELEERGVHTVLWVVVPHANAHLKIEEGDVEPEQDSLTVINKDEKVEICMCYFGTIQRPIVAIKLFKSKEGDWKLKYVGKDLSIPLRGSVSMLRFVRSIHGQFKKHIKAPEVRNMQPNEKFFIRKEEAENLLFGFGIVGSTKRMLKSGKFTHRVRGEMELYDNFSEYHGVVYEQQCDAKDSKFHDYRHLLINAASDDEEQISLKRSEIAGTRFRVLNMEAKSRSLIAPNDELYVRVCDQDSGREVARMTVKGSAFLDGYKNDGSSKMSDGPEPDIMEEGLSDDESDGGSVSGSLVTMLIVKQTVDGWMLCSVGKAIPDPREYLDPKPKLLEVTIISAQNLVPPEASDSVDPYTKIKLTEKMRSKGLVKKKKQKFRTQVKKKTANPEWNERFTFKIFHPEDLFTIAVMDPDVESRIDVPVSVALACDGLERQMRLRRKNDPRCKASIRVQFKRLD